MREFPFSLPWALALLSALGWTTAFSLLQPPVRGLRNLGILASYLLGLAMAVRAPWREAAVVWTAFGLAGGIAYVAYEGWLRWRRPADGDPRRLAPLLHGFLAWPVMLPEVVEYVLAELAVLKPPGAGGERAPSTPPGPMPSK